MNQDKLVTGLTDALRAEGFGRIEKRRSSRSLTISADNGPHSVVVHVVDRAVAPTLPFALNTEVPAREDVLVRAGVPGLRGRSGSGGDGKQARPTRGRRQASR
jgi:hypothetical protein